jgi:PBSX family phage terminase large subunit
VWKGTTEKQKQATALMANYMYTLLVGGSRSGKTFIDLRNMFLRGFAIKSRHVIFRKSFKDVKASIHHETFPSVREHCFPNVHVGVNRTDWFYTLHNGSEIWLAGLDDKERTDKILGKEYSTLWFNEASQLGFDEVETAFSRLAEKSGLPLRCFFDENPPSKKHWTYKLFIEGIHPDTGKKVNKADYAYLLMNPRDNLDNIHPDYIS